MLGEHAPWIVAFSLFTGIIWVVIERIDETFNAKTNSPLFRLGRNLTVLMPILSVSILLADRIYDALTLHQLRFEVAQYLSTESTNFERIQVALNGQGAVEFGLLFFLLFSFFSYHLPSLRHLDVRLRQEFRYRMMRHAGFWMIILAIPLFPDEMYLPKTIEVDLTIFDSLPSWYVLGFAIISGLSLSFAGEMWTAYSIQHAADELNILARNARLKAIVLLIVSFFCLNDVDDQLLRNHHGEVYKEFAFFVISLYLLVCTTAVSIWKKIDRHTSNQHSGSQLLIVVVGTLCVYLLSALTTLDIEMLGLSRIQVFILTTTIFSWVFFSGIASMGLPPLGFDTAKAPELWWFRTMLVFSMPIALFFNDDVILFSSIFIGLCFGTISSQFFGEMKLQKNAVASLACIFLTILTGFVSAQGVGMNSASLLMLWSLVGVVYWVCSEKLISKIHT